MNQYIPNILPGTTLPEAAVKYMAAGMFIVPTTFGSKNPGSLLGNGWPQQSSRDIDTVAAWIDTFGDRWGGIGCHLGRSGLVVMDIDVPSKIPAEIRAFVDECHPPFQMTRAAGGRGHIFARVPDGLRLGNGLGALPKGFGDIRGHNGFVMLCPSVHEKASEGGAYEWDSDAEQMPVPYLSEAIVTLLPDACDGGAFSVASEAQVTRALAAWDALPRVTSPARGRGLADGVVRAATELFESGDSRHQVAVTMALWVVEDAAARLYPASEVLERVRRLFYASFVNSKPGQRDRPRQGEWEGIVGYAVAKVLAKTPKELQARAQLKLQEPTRIAGIEVPPAASRPVQAVPPAAYDRSWEECKLLVMEAKRSRAKNKRHLLLEERARRNPVVPGLIGAGLTCFAANPKVGKTRLMVQLMRALVTGGVFLGRQVPQRRVMFLSMDTDYEVVLDMIGDMEKALGSTEMNDSDDWYLSEAPAPEDVPGGDWLQWLHGQKTNPDADMFDFLNGVPPVLIIDTLLQMSTLVDDEKTQSPASDVRMMRAISDMRLIVPWMDIIVIHHNRKDNTSSDPFDRISGSNGVRGSTNGNLVIEPDPNGGEATNDFFLYMESRTLKSEKSMLISRDADGLFYCFNGTQAGSRDAATAYRISKSKEGLVRRAGRPKSLERLALEKHFEGGDGMSLQACYEMFPHLDTEKVRDMLKKLVAGGLITYDRQTLHYSSTQCSDFPESEAVRSRA